MNLNKNIENAFIVARKTYENVQDIVATMIKYRYNYDNE